MLLQAAAADLVLRRFLKQGAHPFHYDVVAEAVLVLAQRETDLLQRLDALVGERPDRGHVDCRPQLARGADDVLLLVLDSETDERIHDVAVRVEAEARRQVRRTRGVVHLRPRAFRPFPRAGPGGVEGGDRLVAKELVVLADHVRLLSTADLAQISSAVQRPHTRPELGRRCAGCCLSSRAARDHSSAMCLARQCRARPPRAGC